VKLLEGLLAYGVTTSKRGAYAPPQPKALVGLRPVLGRAYGGRSE
jgi:hypothetical protein